MRNIKRSGLLFGLIVCLCCCVVVELFYCSNDAGYCDGSSCYFNKPSTQLVKELIRDCGNSSSHVFVYKDYISTDYGNLIIDLELSPNVLSFYLHNYKDNDIMRIRTDTENTALTNILTYPHIELESNDFFNHFTGLEMIRIGYLVSRKPPSFKKLQSLTYLSFLLVGSETRTFDDEIVSGLTNLVYLSFQFSNFKGITKGAFRNLYQLTILRIGYSKITYIEDGVFTDCVNLQILDITNIGLINISNNVFEGLSGLTQLIASQNPGFPVSVLSQTRNLVTIDLNYNEYQTLDPYVFQQMKQLTNLGLNDPFLCDCKLQWTSVISQFGITIGWSPRCSQPLEFQQNHIYNTSVYSNCSQSQTYQCFDKSITCPSNLVCYNTNISYTCGCPIGYASDVSGDCIDVNECDKVTNCQHTCVNTEGSFYCICDKGYKLASNGYDCDDVNECHEWNGGCEHGCGNTIGSYQCYCQEGHQLHNQTHCETNIKCDVVDDGDYQDNVFTCRGGFNITIANLTCDPHVQPTMETIPATSATDCPIGFLQHSSGECVDEDECDKETKCEHTCVNTQGSFHCMCPRGYQLTSNQYNCSDVNECQEWNGGCEYGCGNTIGSYRCYCENGHSLKNETHCEDIIECDVIDHGGYQDNIFTCRGGFNITITNLTCDHSVQSTTETIPVTSATSCPIGYLQRSTGECVDEDECDQETKCEHTCMNTEGSFHCMCPEGYQLTSNQHNCSDVNECQKWNGGCEYGCGNTVGSYHCYCENGHSLKNETHCETNIECEAIDHRDCLDNTFVCQGGFNITVTNLTCHPHVEPTTEIIPVTSATGCPIGYVQRSTGECVDEDECIQEMICEHTCVNTQGSFYCMCSQGYQLASNQYDCDDVNECQEWNGGCEYGCGNTIGSYQCYCENGHSLKNETHCNDRIECELIEIISTDKQESSYICKGGYNLTVSGLSCPNVNSQQNTIPNETTNHTAECTSEPNLSTVQSESSLTIPLVLFMGISLITNLVFIVLIIAVFIYFLRKKNGKGHGNPKHRIPEIQANLHPTNELALPEIPNDASLTTPGFNNQDTQNYPLTINEENGDYANLK